MANWKKVVTESSANTISQATSGNAATATALETARNIGGVSFDGTANINLPGVNQSGTQDTSGNAATATTATTVSDNAITMAKLAGIARGKIIYGDTNGNPALLDVGSNGQILRSDGTDISWGADAGFNFPSDLNADAGGGFTIGNQADDLCTFTGSVQVGTQLQIYGPSSGTEDAILRLAANNNATSASRFDIYADHSESKLTFRRWVNSGTSSIMATLDGDGLDVSNNGIKCNNIETDIDFTINAVQDCIIKLDSDEDTSAHTAQFEIQDHDGNIEFKVTEAGEVTSTGSITAGGNISAGPNTITGANVQAVGGTLKVKNSINQEKFSVDNNGNVTMAGDLTVSGTTITTSTETLEIADNTLVLNSDLTGTAVDAGFVVQLGSSSGNNANLWYDVTAGADDTTGRWVVGSTDDGTAEIGGYSADIMQVRIDGGYDASSTEVPVGHMQYDNGVLYLRVED
mgnify:CR=1 FL=1